MRRPAGRRLAAALAVILLAAACGGSPTAQGGGEGDGAARQEKDPYADLMALSQEELVARAQKEGELNLYTSMNADFVDVVAGAFEDTYDIPVNVYRASSETVLQRVLQEQDAGFAGNDVVETNGSEMVLLEQEGLLTPYERPARDGVAEAGVFDTWTATRFNLFAPAWNTNLVPAGQVPKSLEELADPKWAGKVSLELTDVDWFLTMWDHLLGQGMSEAEIERLFRGVAQNAKIVKGHSVQNELLSAGQFAVAAAQYTYIADRAEADGAPVSNDPLIEPVISRPNGFGLMRTAQHPAAALLFGDWILTDGQDVLIEEGATPSVEAKSRDLAAADLVPVDLQKYLDEGKQWEERYQRIIAEGEVVEGTGGS